MRLAILSDFHLGYGRFQEDAYRQAREAVTKASTAADALLIPGDVFDTRTPEPEALAQAINIFRELRSKDWSAKVVSCDAARGNYTSLPIVAVAGTHERRAEGVENPIGLMNLAGMLVDISDGSAVIEKEGERVAVCGMGGIEDTMFRDALVRRAPKPVEGMFNVFMFHESIYDLLPFNDAFVRIDELPDGFDLYVNGHIHSSVETEVHGRPFLIPGSTVLTQLKEGEQASKGFFLFDTERKSYEFVPINSRPFKYMKFDISGMHADHAISVLGEEIEAISRNYELPIIRIQLDGTPLSGANTMDIELRQLAKRYKGSAIIEITKNGADNGIVGLGIAEAKSKMLDGASIRDFGMGVLLEKFRDKKGDLGMDISELFELLSADGSKDKAVAAALERLTAKTF
ncbi:MAG: DNA repair exonuclease [Candidatus Micrarchaeota archaeon]|nr:DNA repair exonuclease [Candidatus Micrarchaeota archaeon]